MKAGGANLRTIIRDFQLNQIINIPCIHWYGKYCAIFRVILVQTPPQSMVPIKRYKQKKLTM